jgi:hypothetical protein
MKAVVVHSASSWVELDWANQFAGAGAEAAQETAFPGPQWAVRVRRVFTIPGFTAGANRWGPIVDTVKGCGHCGGVRWRRHRRQRSRGRGTDWDEFVRS